MLCHTEHKREIIKDFKHKEFDHNKSLFTLAGKHVLAECEKCHLKTEEKTVTKRFTYIGISRDCTGCHENIHRTKSSEKCDNCHGEDEWKKTTFDHNTQSRYKLSGLHGSITCEKCHKEKGGSGKIRDFSLPGFDSCLTCHEDTHKGSLSPDCLQCHTLKGWKTLVFSHEQSKYQLRGAHKKAACNSCHTANKYVGLNYKKCSDCHKKTPHNGLHEPCTSCHGEESWKTLVKGWDRDVEGHGRYDYQLAGAHTNVACNKCHESDNTVVYFKMNYSKCIDCHRDEHNRQFPEKKCDECHVLEDFKKLTFDHERADFKLEVMHKDIQCEKCHEDKKYKPVPVNCEECHNEITKYYRGMFNTYPVVIPSPKSRLVMCEKCHETNKENFKADGNTCISCHEKVYEDFFNTWSNYMKDQLSSLAVKMKTIDGCENLPPETLESMKKKKDEIEFVGKNFYHNYRLSESIMGEYNELLDRVLSEECH
jgi:hypothetical protein